ncbi:MAG: acyltransferase family protein [Lacunisphaera sp.]
MSASLLTVSPSRPSHIVAASTARSAVGTRLDYLDATRAFALLLGVLFHAAMSFSPYFMGWAVQDISTSPWVTNFFLVSHSFRMELFFLLAGLFSRGMLVRRGLGEFLRSRAIRLGVPFVVGWFILRPLIVSGWIMGSASMRGDYSFWAGIRAGFATLKTLPTDLLTGTHLWFLYYLILVTGVTLTVRAVVHGADRAFPVRDLLPRLDALAFWLSRSAWAWPVLILPTAGAMWGMRYWGMDTPDRTLWPQLPVLAVYGGFFGLGWLFARQPDAITAFGRVTAVRVLYSVGSFVLTLKLSAVQTDLGHPHYFAARVAFTLGYAVMMWTLVALTLGVFRKFCAEARPAIRYLADSSYWVYLFHLPVVVWLQVAVAEMPVHWSLKLIFITAVTIGLALLTYDLFVRSTIIGQILNGRRRPRAFSLARGGGKTDAGHLQLR